MISVLDTDKCTKIIVDVTNMLKMKFYAFEYDGEYFMDYSIESRVFAIRITTTKYA